MKEVGKSRMTTCPKCHGKGACRRCSGTGHDPVFGYRRKCVLCSGSGLCLQCGGSGIVPKEQPHWRLMIF
jgi:DnaJ-class molecular chaperone